MPDLGKATYELVFDTRQGEVAIAGLEARADAAGRNISKSMGMAEKSVADVGVTTEAAAGEVEAGTTTMTGGFTEAGAAADKMGGEVAAANATAAESSAVAAKKSTGAWAAAGASMSKIGGKMKSIGRSMTHKVTLPIVAVGALATVEALKYGEAIKMIRTQAGGTEREVTRMNRAVLALAQSGKVTHGPNELAKALYHLESSGIRGKAALQALTQADHLATVGGAKLEDTTDAVAKAYSSGIGGAHKFSQAVGIINATVGAGNMRLSDFNAAMGTGVYNAAVSAGVPLQAVGAALATFTTSGLPAVQSMTAFKMSLISLQKPTKQQVEGMKLLGYTSKELARDIRTKGLIPTIEDLSKRYTHLKKQFGPEEANKILLTAFGGAKSAKAMLALVQQHARLAKNYDQVNRKTKDFAKLTSEAMHEPVNKMRAQLAKIGATLIKVGNILVPIVGKIVAGLGKLFDMFDKLSPHMKTLVLIGVGIAAAVGPVMMLVGALVGIGAVPALIIAVIAALAILYVKSKTIRNAIRDIAKAAKPAFHAIVVFAVTAFNLVRHHWKQLMMIFKPYLKYLVDLFKTAFGFIARVFKLLTDIMRGHWHAVWKDILGIVKFAVKQMGVILWDIVGIFAGVGKAAFSVMKGWMGSIVNVVVDAINWITGKLNAIKVPTGIHVKTKYGVPVGVKVSYSHPFNIGKVGNVDWGGKHSGPTEVIGDHGGGAGGGTVHPTHGRTHPRHHAATTPPKMPMPDLGAGGYDPNAGDINKFDNPASAKKKHHHKKKKKKRGTVASLGGAYDKTDAAYQDKLDIIEAKIAEAHTKRAKDALIKQEMRILNAEEGYLKKKLKLRGLSLKKQAEISREITAIEKKKLALAKQSKKTSSQLGKEYEAVLETRGTFFSEFAGDIFGKSAGGLTIGGESGDTNVNVNQTNHYNEIPKNRHAHARAMQRAAADAMSGV